MSPVRQQGEEGSCTGHGTAAGMNYLCRDNPSQEPHDKCTVYSPRFAYYNARRYGGANQLRQDNGAFIRNAIKGVVYYGVCPDSDWPYQPGEYKKAPTPAQLRAGQSWMLDKYLKCLTLNGVLSALHKGHPIVAGFMCHTGMWKDEVTKTGVLPVPTDADQPDGGHCTLWCG